MFIIQPWNLHLNILGVIFILVSAAAFALYGVLGKKQCAKLGGIVVTCGGFLFGSAEMMILAALSHIPAVASALSSGVLKNFAAIPFVSGYAVDNLLVVLYVCICCTGIGYTCYFLAMERVSAQTVSMVFFFKPVPGAYHGRGDSGRSDSQQHGHRHLSDPGRLSGLHG